MDEDCISRAELLSGGLNRGRSAAKLLAAIEARCIYMRDESRRVVAAYLLEGSGDFRRCFDDGYLQNLKRLAESADALLLDHLGGWRLPQQLAGGCDAAADWQRHRARHRLQSISAQEIAVRVWPQYFWMAGALLSDDARGPPRVRLT